MRFRNCVVLLVLLNGILLMPRIVWAQGGVKSGKTYEAPRVWTEAEAIDWLVRSHGFKAQGFLSEGVLSDFEMVRQTLKTLADPTNLINAVLAYPMPSDEPELWDSQLFTLVPYKNRPEVYNYVQNCLNSGIAEQEIAAAHTVLYWGDWYTAKPYILAHGDYLIFQNLGSVVDSLPADARNTLVQVALTGTPEEMITAASALFVYDDTLTIINASRYVLQTATPNDPDVSNARAKYTAMRTLAKYKVTDQIADYGRLAADDNLLVRITAVDMLELFGANGVVEAIDELEKIATMNPDLRLRETARLALQRIQGGR